MAFVFKEYNPTLQCSSPINFKNNISLKDVLFKSFKTIGLRYFLFVNDVNELIGFKNVKKNLIAENFR